jgi:hypothetical protein
MNLEVLQELTMILPLDAYLTQYSYKEGSITIGGMSGGSADDLRQKLEKSPRLKDVVQNGPIFKNTTTGKYQFNFAMKLER